MRLPVDALADWMNPVPPEGEAARLLTGIGFEVEGREETAAGPALEINVTPNRGDCLSVRGLARELCAALDRPFRDPAPPPLPPALANSSLAIALPDPRCPRFLGVEIRGVKRGATPPRIKRLLEAFGMRPVSPLVDAANLVMLELGQPLHTYDLQSLRGAITVRGARAGETLVTLDGKKRDLSPWPVTGQPFAPLLICDDRDGARPIGLAGVMGGGETEIADGSTDLYLEAASFDPVAVRRAAKKFTLHSEASHRFERGVDPELPRLAAARFLQILNDWGCGGTVAGWRFVETAKAENRAVELRPAALKRLLGVELPAEFTAGKFAALGLKKLDGGRWGIPSWRADLAIEEDLIEEAGRHFGYDRIGETLPSGVDPAPGRSDAQRTLERLRRKALALGFSEQISIPFTAGRPAVQFERFEQPVALANPIWLNQPELQLELGAMVEKALRHNLQPDVLEGRAPDARLFEIGRTYASCGQNRDGRLVEKTAMALAVATPAKLGRRERRDLLRDLAWQLFGVARWENYLSGEVDRGDYRDDRDLEIPREDSYPVVIRYAAAAEGGATVNLLVVPDVSRLQFPAVAAVAPPRFPAVIRDLNLLLPRLSGTEALDRTKQPLAVIASAVGRAKPAHLEDHYNLDRGFFGAGLPEGHFALAMRFVFRRNDGTLTADEVEVELEKIRNELNAGGVRIRA